MSKVTLVLDATTEGTFDLRAAPAEVAEYVTDVVVPLLEALAQIYSSATLALILDIAAKTACYAAAEDAPCPEASRLLRGIFAQQRELLSKTMHAMCNRPLTAELLW